MSRDFEADFDALVDALGEWPKLPSPLVLHWLGDAGDWKIDWPRGKAIQSELPMGAVPYSCECEIGAGFWDRITNGAWREHLSKAVPPQEQP